MSTETDTMSQTPFGGGARAPAASHTRPFYWSLRRELWENRSIYIAPLIAAALILFSIVIGMMRLAGRAHELWTLDPAHQHMVTEAPFDIAAVVIIVVSVVTAAFYSLGALHGERRDRSILFWKSLPVSDLTAVLAKASVPLVILPVVAWVVILATQLVIFLIGTLLLLAHGQGVAELWAQDPVFDRFWVLPYGLITLSLWYAPVYGWLMLVSAWARKAPFLWAVGVPFALGLVERLALGSSVVASVLKHRVHGGFDEAFDIPPHVKGAVGGMGVVQPDLARFLGSPDLWIGLIVAAAFFGGAVWLRRRGEPL